MPAIRNDTIIHNVSVPENWVVKRLKYWATDISKGVGITKEDVVEDGNTPCVRYGEIYSKFNHAFFACLSATNKEQLSSVKSFSYGDILFAGTGELIDEIGKSIVYLGSQVCLAGGDIILVQHEQNPSFLNYALNCQYAQAQKSCGKIKLKVVHISAYEIGNIDIALPPISEQNRIAAFLDTQCASLDALSADIQSQIDVLEQYKKSVITEAVTKGLNPEVEMKDSGIEWVGMIPNHWAVAKIGQVYTLRNQKVSDTQYPPLSVTMKGILPQLDTVAKTDAHDDRKLVRQGDFAINSRSDRRGSCGISPMDGSVSLINLVLAPMGEMNPGYYNWLFHTGSFADEFYKWGNGIVDDLWTTRWQSMKKIGIPMPSLDEQASIADYLDHKCAEIDAAIAEKKAQLETIAEYKKSMIYEYVTGKKEIPDEQSVSTAQAKILKPKMTFEEFCAEVGMAARASSMSSADLHAMYEAFYDDNATV